MTVVALIRSDSVGYLQCGSKKRVAVCDGKANGFGMTLVIAMGAALMT